MSRMEAPGIRPVDNEGESHASRQSKEGKTFTYRLNVIQQPERARACGSGAKSSADRRPVDPPPIVELKIYEGEGEADLKDVTFSMNSNYLLFATLEQARNIAHGRVNSEQHRPTVLTGTPVAGMVYLDRPSPAGYFIFPDLSVRHEGMYRLSFNLYEESKDTKDEDRIEDNAKPSGWRAGYVTHRLEVRSKPFTVYSAKKFPGLAESTILSRTVAEQGCRVRIRRDVRMRRRDTKSNKDWEGYEDDTSELRARVSATPEAAGYPHGYMEPVQRPRSASNASHPSLAPLSRRPSLQDIHQGYHQTPYGMAPTTPQSAYPQSSPYMGGPSPNQPYAQSQFVQHQSAMQPPPPSYHQQQSHQLPPAAPSQPGPYGYGPPPAYDPAYQSQRPSVDYSSHVAQDHRRPSSLYQPPPAHPQPSYASAPVHSSQSGYSHAYQPSYASQQTQPPPSAGPMDYSRIAPAEPIQPPLRTSGAHTPLSARTFSSDKLPPLTTAFNTTSMKPIEPASPVSAAPQSSQYSATSRSTDSHKRIYGQVFNERHLAQPLRRGARPSASEYMAASTPEPYGSVDADSLQEPEHDFQNHMVYRRADGRQVNRNLPPHD